MKTLADIVALGDAAAAAGEPLVDNWPQLRGNIHLFGHIFGSLEQILTADFDTRFPEEFEDLSLADQAAFPNARMYRARTQIARVLAALGEIDDPWEALRVMIRQAGRRAEIELHWGALKTPAIAAGLAPADIRTEWVWSLDVEAEGGFRRMRLRRSALLFNRLFDIPEIAASGLLPPERIGPPPRPIYDQKGRLRVDLPPMLASYHVDDFQALIQVWRVICAADCIDLPMDPSADDLLAPEIWAKIAALPTRVTTLAESSWHQYTSRTRRALLPHARQPLADRLPERFANMAGRESDLSALRALWRQLFVAMPDKLDASPHELLELATWRKIWRETPTNVKPSTLRVHEGRARKILLQHASGQIDPLRRVTRAWADLPKREKAALLPVRKPAEQALLRPLDITHDWLSSIVLDDAERAFIKDGLQKAAAAAAASQLAPDPVAVAWEALRKTAREEGFVTSRMASIVTPAVKDSLMPAELTSEWALQNAMDMSQRQKAKFAMQLRQLDQMIENTTLGPMLYQQPISSLPDARKRGNIDPPAHIFEELETLQNAFNRAASTHREGRAAVRKLYTVAASQRADIKSLSELLHQADTFAPDNVTLRVAKRLYADLMLPCGERRKGYLSQP